MTVKPEDILKDMPTYRVASMVKPTDPNIRIHTIRCKDLEELGEFIRRLLNVGDLQNLYFFEVHELGNGQVKIVHESNIPWPKISTKIQEGVIVPKSSTVPDKTVTQQVLDNLHAIFNENKVDKPAEAATKLDEYLRPFQNYTLKVA